MTTWFLVVTIFGTVAWMAGPMTEAECKGEAKPAMVAYVGRIAAERGSVEFQGRTATRRDVKIDCVPEMEIGR